MADCVWKKRPKMVWWCLVTVLVGISVPFAGGLYIEGEVETFDNWIFLARFCFLSDIGRLRFEVEYPKSFATQNLILYYDEPDQWPAVYPTESVELKTCLQKESVLQPENHQVINLTTAYVWSGCIVTKLDNEERIRFYGDTEKYDCRAGRSFTSRRERWWYVALDNCNSTRGMFLKYKMTFTNGDDYWTRHFSADQFGILQTDIVFLILFGLMFLVSLYTANGLHCRQLLHTTYKMFMTCIVFYMIAMILFIIYYADYASDGTPLNNVKMAALAFMAIGDGVFLLMLILMGKGYTITRGRISHSGSVKIAVLMCIYTMLYAALFVYQIAVFDPGEVLYLYESPAGFALIGIRGICWLWFMYAIFFTLKHYPEKNLFYVPFFLFYTAWFVSTPIMILIATYVFPKWWREKVMNVIELLIAFTAQLAFLIITRPSAANKNFPYHVRTSQIGVVNDPYGGPANNVDGFAHHGYGNNVMEGEGQLPNFTEMFAVTAASNRPVANGYMVNNNASGNKAPSLGDPVYPPTLPTAPPPAPIHQGPYPGPEMGNQQLTQPPSINHRLILPIRVVTKHRHQVTRCTHRRYPRPPCRHPYTRARTPAPKWATSS
ncbi:transmembrane protein 145-like isoform X2 [Patiria miniata]|uniref:Transmembrane protein 145 n=1 Tax=Patiria miniata TaxID=46514 RepID=A0A914AQA8_PATMI|nr:transmembrane protein 145-like isoform X2 [Patiria miniata]